MRACLCACVGYTSRELLRSGVSTGGMHFVCRKFPGAGVSSEGQCFTDERYSSQVWVVGFMKVMLCELWLFQENSDTLLHACTHTHMHVHTCNFYQYNIFNITNENKASG